MKHHCCTILTRGPTESQAILSSGKYFSGIAGVQPCKTYQTRKYLIRRSKTLDILQIQMVSRILHRGLETLLTQTVFHKFDDAERNGQELDTREILTHLLWLKWHKLLIEEILNKQEQRLGGVERMPPTYYIKSQGWSLMDCLLLSP